MHEPPRTQFLCQVSIQLRAGAPVVLGQSPWSNRRISDILDGRFEGPRLKGRIAPSGGDWSQRGGGAGEPVRTLIDVRSLWETDDGATIYVTYGGRLVIPPDALAELADPARVDSLDPARYYFRITPLFETSAPPYVWLNDVVGIGLGRRTSTGVSYRVFEVL
jgi:hypothetical protein